MNNTQIPASYDYIMQYNSQRHPSTTHVTDTYQARFFQRYLLQEFMSLFDFDIPEEWDIDYVKYTLFLWGFLVIFDTAEYGVIPQQCGLTGFDIFHRPNLATVENSQMKKQYFDLKIGKDCALVKMSPDYGGIWDLIAHYADMLAMAVGSLGYNLMNSRLAYVFAADGKANAESFKKAFDEVMNGNPAVVVDKKLFNQNTGDLNMTLFNRDIHNTYIANDILETMRKIKVMFFNDIGVPNANTEKKERLISDEVAANNVETNVKFKLWLDEINRGLTQANRLFGLNLSVKPSFEGSENNGNVVGAVDVQI